MMLAPVAGVVLAVFLLGANGQVTGQKFRQITIKEESWSGVKTGGNRITGRIHCAAACAVEATCDAYIYELSECHTGQASALIGAIASDQNNKTVYMKSTISPTDCKWQWEPWGSCSQTCGPGYRKRSRKVSQKKMYGGVPCTGNRNETQDCNIAQCPVDCTWNPWESWEPCSATCGGGVTNRSRNVDRQAQFGGASCSGASFQTSQCKPQGCPEDGTWKSWSPWSPCSASCGKGKTSRARNCVQPVNNGLPCNGSNTEQKKCTYVNCDVHQRETARHDKEHSLAYLADLGSINCPENGKPVLRDWKMEFSNDQMWMKFTCTNLPNKVPKCPNKTWDKSPVSGTVHIDGFKRNPSGIWILPQERDWGSDELVKMTVHCPNGLLSYLKMLNEPDPNIEEQSTNQFRKDKKNSKPILLPFCSIHWVYLYQCCNGFNESLICEERTTPERNAGHEGPWSILNLKDLTFYLSCPDNTYMQGFSFQKRVQQTHKHMAMKYSCCSLPNP